MALYREASAILKDSIDTRELYRFEGAKSQCKLSSNNPSEYIYLSSTPNHHMYFTTKRIHQLVSEEVSEELGLNLTYRNLRSTTLFPKIRKVVLNADFDDSLYSKRILCTSSFGKLLKENFVSNSTAKGGKRFVERTDIKVYGGGYGLADEWKKLFNYLTYFTATRRISRSDIIIMLVQMKKTGRCLNKENMELIFRDLDRYQYQINEGLSSDFGKYNIIDSLERIVESGLSLPTSRLTLEPKKTIKEVVDDYEKGRKTLVKVLERLDNNRR